jgi:two-component system, LuxR family, response regulator FixJ
MHTTRRATTGKTTTTSFVCSSATTGNGYETTAGQNVAPPIVAQRKIETLICVVGLNDSIRRSVTRLLESKKYSIESFVTVRAFLNRQVHPEPCCVVVDVDPQGTCGLNLQQILSRDSRTEQIIFISGHANIRACARALKAGAVDFLMKPLKNAELLRAVENALVRSKNLVHGQKEKLAAQTLLNKLTPREHEVLGFVIAGKINKEIASELGTGEKTIKKHRGHIMEKLHVGSVAELVHFSLHFGLKPACPYGTKVPYTSMT